MSLLAGKAFSFRGECAGFVETPEGKRRLLVRVDGGEELAFKLPRELRREYEPELVVGRQLAIEGVESRNLFTGREKRVIERVEFLGSAPPVRACERCTIKVCTKKNCWRDGGREVWAALEQRIAQAGLRGVVNLEAVRCLDECKHAPVISVRGQKHRRCSERTAAEIIDAIAQRQPS